MPTLQVIIDSSKAKDGARQFEAATDDVARSAARGTGSLAAFSKGFTVASAAAIGFATVLATRVARSVLDFAQNAVKLASAQGEIESKFAAVFKGEAPAAIERLRDLETRTGRVTERTIGFAASFQDLLVPMGIAREEAAKLSTGLVGLSVDLESFNEEAGPLPAVVNSISSALVGQGRSVLQFGVIINEATVQQEAFRLGLVRSGEELSEQDKVLARISLLYRNTADAQGDAERTAGSFANATRNLTGLLDKQRIAIGENLRDEILETIEELGGVEKVAQTIGVVFTAAGETAKVALGFMTEAAQRTQDLVGEIGGVDNLTLALKALGRGAEEAGKDLEEVSLFIPGGPFGVTKFKVSDLFPTKDEVRGAVEGLAAVERLFQKQEEAARKAAGPTDEDFAEFSRKLAEESSKALSTLTADSEKFAEISRRTIAQQAKFREDETDLLREKADSIEEEIELVNRAEHDYAGYLDALQKAGELNSFQTDKLRELNEAVSEHSRRVLLDADALAARERDARLEEEIALVARAERDYEKYIDVTARAGDLNRVQADSLRELNEAVSEHSRRVLLDADALAEQLRTGDLDARRVAANQLADSEDILRAAIERRLAAEEQARRAADENRIGITASAHAIDGFSSSVAGAAVGYGKFGDLIRRETQSIVFELIRAALQAQLSQESFGSNGVGFSGFLRSLFSSASGTGFNVGEIGPTAAGPPIGAARGMVFESFANGGFPNGRITGRIGFDISRGRRGIAGESGQEIGASTDRRAIFPLTSLGNGKLGIEGSAGGGGTRIDNVTIHVTGVQEPQGFRRLLRAQVRDALEFAER